MISPSNLLPPLTLFTTLTGLATLTTTLLALWLLLALYTIALDRRRAVLRARKNGEKMKWSQRSLKQEWHLAFLRTLPFRSLSRAWGYAHEYNLPKPLRAPLYKLWSYVFGCDLTEMAAPNLETFPNLQSFFIRALKPGVRPIAQTLLVSPADGKVLHYGPVAENTVEQIKGVSYRLDAFLGIGKYMDTKDGGNLSTSKELTKKGHQLYHCVVYLAPGDYHRFHSPANWTVERTKHFAGQLFSVSPAAVRLIKGLFVLNERVVMEGLWDHGYFSMTAVGATNVGSIRIDFDKALKTNKFIRVPYGAYTEKTVIGTDNDPSTNKEGKADSAYDYSPQSPDVTGSDHPTQLMPFENNTDNKLPPLPPKTSSGLFLRAGNEVGRFHLGSTIVLIFEAPEDFRFLVRPGEQIKVGECLGETLSTLGTFAGSSKSNSISATQGRRRTNTVSQFDTQELNGGIFVSHQGHEGFDTGGLHTADEGGSGSDESEEVDSESEDEGREDKRTHES